MNLQAERLNRGLSIAEMAKRAGVTERVLQAAERGAEPRPRNAKKIADFLGCRVTDVWPTPADRAEESAA